MGKLTPAVNTEKKDLRDAVVSAIATLDNIIANVVGSNTTQTQQAIKALAQHQKKIIKRLIQLR